MRLKKGSVLKKRYKIKRLLSDKGGFSLVYLAKDKKRNIDVAIKELFPKDLVERNGNELIIKDEYKFMGLYELFETEAKILKGLNHCYTANYLDSFEENKTYYLVIDYIRGVDLKEYIKSKGKLSFEKAKNIFEKILEVIEYVHSNDIIHRDIKPDNIIITDEEKFDIKLLDFGSACKLDNIDDDFIKVSKGFSPIEMYAMETEQNFATDIYSIFATLLYMLEGKKPLSAPKRIFNNEISLELDEIDISFKNLILKNMNVNIKDRDESVNEIKEKIKNNIYTHESEIKWDKWTTEY